MCRGRFYGENRWKMCCLLRWWRTLRVPCTWSKGPGRLLNPFCGVKMAGDFAERRGDGFYAASTRVSMASIVHHFRLGASPETIFQKFPALGSLSTVYGAVAFYLNNQVMLDAWLAGREQTWKEFEAAADAPPQRLAQTADPVHPQT
jgi:hypothetical protein